MIRFRNYSLYRDGIPLFVDLDIELNERGILAMLGPSGCGKSTLLKIATRLLEPKPYRTGTSGWSAAGSVEVFGRPVQDWNATQLRRTVGLTLQKPWFPPVSVEDAVVRPLTDVRRVGQTRARAKARDVLDQIGLLRDVPDLSTPANRLSGGQMQRLAIARLLALEPEMILMDEPTSALDPAAVATVEDAVSELAKKGPVVVVTHDVAQGLGIAERAILLLPDENNVTRVASDESPAAETWKSQNPRVVTYIKACSKLRQEAQKIIGTGSAS